MIRFISLILFLLSLVIETDAQSDLFDCNNSKKFATYLFNTGQYELAKHELERVDFFCKTDESTELILLKTYRKLNDFSKANLYFESKDQNAFKNMPPEFKTEYIRSLMAQQQFQLVKEKLNKGFEIEESYEYKLGTSLLLQKWEEAYHIAMLEVPASNYKISGLKAVARKSYTAKRKNKFIATALSVLVPGSGKMYCGYWGDGIISLLFTASSGYFAYRAFTKYGSNKVYPWIAGGLAVSYYAGNIYGGNRAAIRYNDNLNHSFLHETEDILYTDY